MLNMTDVMNTIRSHPDFHKVGMILCHNGVVRRTSRDGRKVSGLRISVDHDKLSHLIDNQKRRQGIVEILVGIAADIDLAVGDDVMILAVAGDIRENVIAVLKDTLDTIKTTVTEKVQYYID